MKIIEMSPHDRMRKIAHRAVAKALAEGTLKRPQVCDDCSNPGPKSSDGRATIHGHHYKGYEFPLEVKWLCGKCHCKEDPRASKEANGMSRLDMEKASLIRAKYTPCSTKGGRRQPSPTGDRSLAAEFGVSRGIAASCFCGATIRRVVRNVSWVDR